MCRVLYVSRDRLFSQTLVEDHTHTHTRTKTVTQTDVHSHADIHVVVVVRKMLGARPWLV